MERRNLQPQTGNDQRPLPNDGVRVEGEEAKVFREQDIDVITVCDSWWPTRQQQGVHVRNPSADVLSEVKKVAFKAGTNTVYVYRKNLHFS